MVEVAAAVSGTDGVLDLEGERAVAGAVDVGRRAELELTGGMIGGRDDLAGGNRHAVVGQTAGFFSGGSRDTQSKRDWSSDVCSSDLGKAEIGRREGVGAVLQHRHRVVGAGRGVV